MTLLTSTISWLLANRKRLDQAAEESLRTQLASDDPDGLFLSLIQSPRIYHIVLNKADPPWVIEHALKSRLRDLRSAQEAHSLRLSQAREKERQRRRKAVNGAFGGGGVKRVKVDFEQEKGDQGDEGFLPEDSKGQEADGGDDAEGGNLSREVRELMAR